MLSVQARGVAALLLALTCASEATAGLRQVSGPNVALKPDEGLVALVIDSNFALKSGAFARVGRGSAGVTIGPIPEGRSVHWVAATPETYAWTSLNVLDSYTYSQYFRFTSEDRKPFVVKAGVINYPGDFVVRARVVGGAMYAGFSLCNRMDALIGDLERRGIDITGALPLEYRGDYPDPYPAWLAELSGKATGAAGGAANSAAWNEGIARTLVKDLFRPDATSAMQLNPSADLAIEQGYAEGRYRLNVIDLNTGKITRFLDDPMEPIEVDWDDARTALIAFKLADYRIRVLRFRFSTIPGQAPQFDVTPFPEDGRVLDVLAADPRHVLFERWAPSEKDRLQVLEVDITRDEIDLYSRKRAAPLDKDVSDDLRWLTDGSGALRAVLVEAGERKVLNVRDSDRADWRALTSVPGGATFWPVAADTAGKSIWVLSNHERAQVELLRLDAASGAVVETVHAMPGVDLAAVVLSDVDSLPIGARYYQQGVPRTVFFDRRLGTLQASLEKAFEGSSVLITDLRSKARRALLLVQSDESPGAVYLFDMERKQVEKLADAAPWLSERRFARGETLRVAASDGLAIEAYLYLPREVAKPPLVVLPHGGPLGVRDVRHFDREVQFLAALGYAVLQVNYRGSTGYGKSFLEAGYGSMGRQIEDDIDRATDAVIAGGKVDGARVCIAGTSYGGYSALFAVVRAPERYRCAASLAGVTDVPLLFTGGDIAEDDEARGQWARIAGDPRKDVAASQALSPLYQAAKIGRPVLLANGTEDDRVPIEHARRLRRALAKLGVQQEVVELKDEGHGIDTMAGAEKYYVALAQFLDRHLAR